MVLKMSVRPTQIRNRSYERRTGNCDHSLSLKKRIKQTEVAPLSLHALFNSFNQPLVHF